MDRKLYGKVILKGIIRAETGLHIGASKESLEIGGLDAPVIKHPVSGEPYIPGSSLKGKLRSLFEMKLHTDEGLEFNHKISVGGNIIRMHVCDSYEKAQNCKVCRIFGSSGDTNFPARIKVRDAELTDASRKFIEDGLDIKFENSLDRITAASNPRQIERVPAGTEFDFEIIYNVDDPDQLEEDLINLLSAMELLEDDALGGHGSRGYGRVKFQFSEVVAKPMDVYFEDAEPQKLIEKSGEIKAVKEAVKGKIGQIFRAS